jgi:DNA-3-methyladenine glycosylase I
VKVAGYGSADLERVLKMQGMIKNKAKIAAAVTNAQSFLAVQKEYGSFDRYIWQFVDEKTIKNSYRNLSELPCESTESKAMSIDLRKRGFKFVGPTICYAFMQAAGLVNDHLLGCFRHNQV